MKQLAVWVVMTGQLLAAQTAFAVDETTITREMQSQLQSYLVDKGVVTSVSTSKGTSRSFSSCSEVRVDLIQPVRSIYRPSFEITCLDNSARRRARGIASGSVDIIVSQRSLSRGRMLLGSDIALEKIDMSEYRQGMLFDKQDAFGRALRTPLRKGRTLTDSLLDKKYDILTGQSAALSISRKGLFFSIPVEVLESGRVGDSIPVRNESSGKVFQVTIGENGALKL